MPPSPGPTTGDGSRRHQDSDSRVVQDGEREADVRPWVKRLGSYLHIFGPSAVSDALYRRNQDALDYYIARAKQRELEDFGGVPVLLADGAAATAPEAADAGTSRASAPEGVVSATDDCSSRLHELELLNARLVVERDAAERALEFAKWVAGWGADDLRGMSWNRVRFEAQKAVGAASTTATTKGVASEDLKP